MMKTTKQICLFFNYLILSSLINRRNCALEIEKISINNLRYIQNEHIYYYTKHSDPINITSNRIISVFMEQQQELKVLKLVWQNKLNN